MSKMGEELEKRLDENKHEMWRVLRWAKEDLDFDILIKDSTKRAIRNVVSKIRGN